MKRSLPFEVLQAASSLLFFSHKEEWSSGAASVCLPEACFCIENDALMVENCFPRFEVHHYEPGALHSQADGVREGSLVFASPRSSEYSMGVESGISALAEYWRYLFHAGKTAFGDMARKIEKLDDSMRVYLIAKPGTNAAEYRFEKRSLEYPSLSGLEGLVSDYDLIDVALEDPSLEWVRFVGHAHLDLVEAWTSTLDRAFKLLGIIVSSVIAGKATKSQVLKTLRKLSGCSSAAGRVLSAHESETSVQETIQLIVSSAHPLLETGRITKESFGSAPYLRALGIEVLYYVEKMLPGRVEMAHDAVKLQRRVKKRCDKVSWSDAFEASIGRLEKEPEFRDDVWAMFVCLKYSVLVPDMKEALVRESIEMCQKHQLQEAIPVLFMLSLGRWDWRNLEGFYQQLKSCQSIEAMLQGIAGFVAESKEHECKRQSYWSLYCEGMPSSAPHFADFVMNALSCGRVFEHSYCSCNMCVQWGVSKEVLFHCVGEALSRPMGLHCNIRRFLSHLTHCRRNAELVGFRTCIDSMRPSWHRQHTLDDVVAEFVYRNGPPLMRRALATYADRMKLVGRTMSELPNRAVLVELVRGVPEGSRLNRICHATRFSENGIGAAEVAARWMSANLDYDVPSRPFMSETVCVLEDGVVTMSMHAFEDPNMEASLIQYAGPRTVAQLSRTINGRHSHISVQADQQNNRIRVCRVVGNEVYNGWWTRSVVLRRSPGRGASLFQFNGDREHTVYFSADSTGAELFCIFQPSFCTDLDLESVLATYRKEAGTVGRASAARFDSDVAPVVHENGELDSLASLSGVEVRLTEANKTNPVVRVLSEYCLDGIPYAIQSVKSWDHMRCMIRELSWKLIAAFRVSSGQ